MTGTRHTCPVCGYRCGWGSHMNDHMRVEHGAGPTVKIQSRMRTKKYTPGQKQFIRTLAVLLADNIPAKVEALASCPTLAPNFYACRNTSPIVGNITVDEAERALVAFLSR